MLRSKRSSACPQGLSRDHLQRQSLAQGTAEHSQRALGTALEGVRRPRHRDQYSYRIGRAGPACIDGIADRCLDHDHADLDRQFSGGLAAPQGIAALSAPRSRCPKAGSAGIPYFLERADFVHEHHKAWTHADFGKKKPSDVFREHFLTCFIDDAFGLEISTRSARIMSPMNAIIRTPIRCGQDRPTA